MGSYKNFYLNSESYLIKGATRGAIYNLNTGDIFSIDTDGYKILEWLENHSTIHDVTKKIPYMNENIYSYLHTIENLGLGKFYTDNTPPKKREDNIEYEVLQPGLLWLEITSKCNLSCVHCYCESGSQCTRDRMTFNRWKRVLEEAKEIGYKHIQFIGGEPFLMGDKLFCLLEFARRLGYGFIEIFTNATLLDDQKVEILKRLEVKLAVSFYSKRQEIHDMITGKRGSFHRTVNNIRLLKRKGIPHRVAIIVMRSNEYYLKETITFVKRELGIEDVSYGVVLPVGRGTSNNVVPTEFMKNKANILAFPKLDLETFFLRRCGHDCFSQTLCVTSDGGVLPCIMERNTVLGNFNKHPLLEIYQNETSVKIRNLTKDNIQICKDCEYRYACFDCRPLSKWKNLDNFYCKPRWCLYDPYSAGSRKLEIKNITVERTHNCLYEQKPCVPYEPRCVPGWNLPNEAETELSTCVPGYPPCGQKPCVPTRGPECVPKSNSLSKAENELSTCVPGWPCGPSCRPTPF